LSHEIRNPLSAVKLNLQILKKNNLLKGNDQRRIDISVNEVNRLESILNELLDFAKPVNLKLEPCDLNAMVSHCIELLEIKFREKRLIVQLCLDDRITDVTVDPEKIMQAVINLLLNAIEASPEDGVIEMRTRYRRDKSRSEVVIGVKDQGEGIAPGNVEGLFEPFYTTKSQGTGLGLTNVKRVATAHGGKVAFNCQGEQGAAFYLILPLGGHNGQSTHY
jgi:signal transduction histidine kinase